MEYGSIFRDLSVVFMAGTQVYFAVSFYRIFRTVNDDAKGQRTEFFSLLKHSIDTIKSGSLEERVAATAAEKQHKVHLEMMRDAFADETSQEDQRVPEPVLARTEDGTQINMREYDIL